MANTDRYSRQILVAQLAENGQTRLAESRVLIVGMGGLGCQVAAQLAGAGVGELTLIDHDVIDITNLHRQILFREADIGEAKVSIAKRECEAINSEIKVKAFNKWLGTNSAKHHVANTDLVIDAADNMATSYLLSDACLAARVPLLSASVNRTFGYLGVFCGTTAKPAPSLRAVFPRLPRSQQSCDTVGVTGPSVGIVASFQAQEALKALLNDDDQLLGQLLYLDLWNYQQHKVDFSNAIEPNEKQVALISADALLATDYVIDVRDADEIIAQPQTFKTNQQIPLAELGSQRIAPLETGRIVLACRSGQRALSGAQQLIDLGHKTVAAVMPDGE